MIVDLDWCIKVGVHTDRESILQNLRSAVIESSGSCYIGEMAHLSTAS